MTSVRTRHVVRVDTKVWLAEDDVTDEKVGEWLFVPCETYVSLERECFVVQ